MNATQANHYSYLPIDVGFDLRLRAQALILPADAKSVTFMTPAKKATTATGTRVELAQALRRAGYKVKL